jgi:hypothetical protein
MEDPERAPAELAPADPGIALMRRYAWLMDDCIRIPGTDRRIGIDPLLGLIPGAGDAAGGLLSLAPMFMASRLGAPNAVLLRMAGNVAVDTLLGAVPLLGDLFDAGWKANKRNVQLLERYASDPRPVARSSRWLVFVLVAALVLLILGSIIGAVLVLRWLVGLLT